MKKMKKILIVVVIFLLLPGGVAVTAEVAFPNSFLSFTDAEQMALKNSHVVASQKYTVESAQARAFAQEVKRLPRLDFGASSTFVSKIGEMSLTPLPFERKVGSNTNWRVGPALNWVVWDTGQIMNKAKSLDKISSAEMELLSNDRRQVLLNTRIAYINVQLAKAQLVLVRSALDLARFQYSVVSQKKEAGTTDLFDLTVAHQEVVDHEKELEQATGNLAVAKRGLTAVLGYDAEQEDMNKLDVEPIDSVLKRLLPRSTLPVIVEEHPEVKALADKQHSSELEAKSVSAKHWPEVTMMGTSTFEYPNLGVNQTIQQNKLVLGLGVPILDWGLISKQVKSYKYEAHSTGEQKEQTMIDLARRTAEIRENIQTCKSLRIANARAVKDAVEVAKLSYDSYQIGRIIFLDVQRANVKALSVKIDAATNDANLAAQISNLLFLAEDAWEGKYE